MAAIREELVLADRFSAPFTKYMSFLRQASSTSTAAADSQKAYSSAVSSSSEAIGDMASSSDRALRSLEEINSAVQKLADGTSDAANKQENVNRKFREGTQAAGGLGSKLKTLAAAYLSLRTAQQFINLTDTFTQTTARLERMNDGLQTTAELQNMIYQAAQRSRGVYQGTEDMVAKLGTLAPDAFSSSQELVAFAEQINKQFALAGTSAQGADAAMLQLTQAMSSGVLRGEELNSVLEQAPTIAQAIADYLGVNIGKMREMASEGEITAQVVKNALFAAADETNAAFEAVPLTFSQAWTMAKNAAVNAFRPAMEELNNLLNSDIGRDALNGLIYAAQLAGRAVTRLIQLVGQGAEWIRDNWEAVSTVLIGLAIAVGAAMVASAIQSAAAWAVANWPLLLIIGTIALEIYMVRQMGVTWEEVGGVVGGILYELFALGNNLVADVWNLLATFAEFFANLFNNPAAAIAHLLADLADWALSILQSLASAIDAVFGSNLADAVNGWRSNVQDWASSFGENEIKIQRMNKIYYDDAWDRGSQMGRSVGAALDNFNVSDIVGSFAGSGFDYSNMLGASGIPDILDGIKGDTAAIKRSVSLSEEDMKLLVDMAERRYVNNINLTAQTPIITINGQNTGDTAEDLQWLENALQKILMEQAASHTDMSYQ